ncbi:Mediator of RNA polymerase II transcription subunit 6 [Nosema bombycis CQ1]|uniref:Mediator of RNA polymerase II transcription subunit 6 n=1 Tax=Nosema bombycis (strain CQ1 / CVCC 102059) TaxID=578461 RepID=R0MJP6_NOSB1|nr:Mediator of RNA polymerase II transcription subunit 6 [Nosema bombycis CQ1]|eukprot:EOB14425.1 Mediator of RNA polymerase II transcription subunit 6 [Nosema bombycis CQ1]
MENISFVDTNFLTYNPLNETNILDYFSTSPFYDSSSNNEVLKMQSQYTGNKINQQVENLRGVYFILDFKNQENTLFIIRKSENVNQNLTLNLNFYYVIHGHIYEAPSDSFLYTVRSTEIFFKLNKLLDLEDLDFDPLALEETKSDQQIEDSKFGIIRDIFEVFHRKK